jgi:hypothetical protein
METKQGYGAGGMKKGRQKERKQKRTGAGLYLAHLQIAQIGLRETMKQSRSRSRRR